MNTVISTILLSQLCYDASQDLGDHFWLKKAQLLEQPLIAMVTEKKSGCLELNSDAKRKEAALLVRFDGSGKTLSLE